MLIVVRLRLIMKNLLPISEKFARSLSSISSNGSNPLVIAKEQLTLCKWSKKNCLQFISDQGV